MYEADFNVEWLKWAFDLQRVQDDMFWDDKACTFCCVFFYVMYYFYVILNYFTIIYFYTIYFFISLNFSQQHGGYFAVSGQDKSILLRLKEEYDGAEPSGNSVAAMNLLRLTNLTDKSTYREKAARTMDAFSKLMLESPVVMPYMCAALNYSLSPPTHIVIAGAAEKADTQALLRVAQETFTPNKVLVLADQGANQAFLQQVLMTHTHSRTHAHEISHTHRHAPAHLYTAYTEHTNTRSLTHTFTFFAT